MNGPDAEVIVAATSVVCAAGGSLDESLETMASGVVRASVEYAGELPRRSGGIPVYRVDDSKWAAEVPRRVLNMDRSTVLAWKAVSEMGDLIRDFVEADGGRKGGGIFLGSSRGPVEKQVQAIEGWRNGRQRPGFAVDVPFGATAGFLAGMLGVSGPVLTVSATCCSGAHALIEAAWAIRSGRMAWVLVVAADAAVHPSVLGQMQTAGMLTSECDEAARGCIPFHASRTGTTLGEGAAAVLLCGREWYRRLLPDSQPPGWLCGWDSSTDCHSRTLSDPDGLSLEESVRASLAMAGISASSLEYVSPHGTGTVYNDEVELNAMRRLFPSTTAAIPGLVPTKHYTGHCLGATSLMEICFLLEFLRGAPLPCMRYLDDSPLPAGFSEATEWEGSSVTRPWSHGLSQSLGFWGNINSVVVAAPVSTP